MKCNCFDELLEVARKPLEGKNELEVKWQNRVFFLSGEPNAPTVLKIEREYRGVKVNGQPCKNKTKDSVNVVLKFCPFCSVQIK